MVTSVIQFVSWAEESGMRFDQHPVFRDLIIPWYDSNALCYIVVGLMVLVFLFSAAGVSLAMRVSEYRHHMWVPLLLMGLSSGVIVSTIIRLVRRRR